MCGELQITKGRENKRGKGEGKIQKRKNPGCSVGPCPGRGNVGKDNNQKGTNVGTCNKSTKGKCKGEGGPGNPK